MIQNYSDLPRRQFNFTSSSTRNFITNCYSIRLIQEKCMIYLYSFSVEPQIKSDSPHKFYKIIHSAYDQLKKKIGLKLVRGNNLYGSINLKTATTQISKVKDQQGHITQYEILIKKVKDLPLLDMISVGTETEKTIATQILNIDTKNRLRKNNMVQLDKGKYFLNQKILVSNFSNGFYVQKGFGFTIQKLRIGLCLQVELLSRVIRERNVLQQLLACKSIDQQKALIENSMVIARYGNYKCYVISQLDYKQSPLSKFTPANQPKSITYAEYYKANYDVKIQSLKQPLLKARLKRNKQLGQQIYLVPQLMSFVGLSQQQRKNQFLMRDMATRTQYTAQKRISESNEKITQLNEYEELFKINNQAARLRGFQLRQPQIEMRRTFQARNGQIKLDRQLLKQPMRLRKWYMMMHSNNVDDAQNLESAMINASKVFGIELDDAIFIKMKDNNPKTWRNQIQQQIQYLQDKNEQLPSIIMFVIGGNVKDVIYKQLKNICTTKFNICTQFVVSNKISGMAKKNTLMSYASNILLQINAKINKTLWTVPTSHAALQKKSIAIGAFSVSKYSSSFALAFVGTVHNKFNKVYSETCRKKNKTQFGQQIYHKILMNWLKTYYQTNNRQGLPQIIVLYEEGHSVSQANKAYQLAIKALGEAIAEAKSKTKINNYKPQIVYMTIKRNSGFRFYDEVRQNNNKFSPAYHNPQSGSIIVDEMNSSKYLKFHLSPCHPNTPYNINPTQFTMYYHEPKITPDEAFIQLSFEQCFNYYNYKGATKAPACLQNADKLAKLASTVFDNDVTLDNQLSKMFHFL